MKPKILIKVVGAARGDFILEYPDQETLQRSLELALPKLIEGGMFVAQKLEFPLRIGGIEHQWDAPLVIDRLHFPGKYTVQECLAACKKQNVEVVSYTLSRKTTHEFVVRRTHSLKGVAPQVVVSDDLFPETPIPPPEKGDEIPSSEEQRTDAWGALIHTGCGGKISTDSGPERCLKCGHKWNR